MARRKIPMPSAEAIRALADGEGRLAIRATRNISTDTIFLPAEASASELLLRIGAGRG